MANVELFNHPTNDAWCRDHGPIFVRNDRSGEVAITDWKFWELVGRKIPPPTAWTTVGSRPASPARSCGGRSRTRWCSRGDQST